MSRSSFAEGHLPQPFPKLFRQQLLLLPTVPKAAGAPQTHSLLELLLSSQHPTAFTTIKIVQEFHTGWCGTATAFQLSLLDRRHFCSCSQQSTSATAFLFFLFDFDFPSGTLSLYSLEVAPFKRKPNGDTLSGHLDCRSILCALKSIGSFTLSYREQTQVRVQRLAFILPSFNQLDPAFVFDLALPTYPTTSLQGFMQLCRSLS